MKHPTQFDLLNYYINKEGLLIVKEQIEIPVKVVEAKFSYGKLRLLVRSLLPGNTYQVCWINAKGNNIVRFQLKGN